jgi:hypothetical protein
LIDRYIDNLKEGEEEGKGEGGEKLEKKEKKMQKAGGVYNKCVHTYPRKEYYMRQRER